MESAAPLSVWPCAQQPSRLQRRDRYVPESVAHPGKMLPEIARRAISAYSAPGDVVLDPMCGIGTSLVEAVHLGRNAFGIEYESRWAELAEANLALAEAFGATGSGAIRQGDAREMGSLVPASMRGRIALVLMSPPYGSSVHGQVRVRAGEVLKHDDRYSRDTSNLAHVGEVELLHAVRDIFAAAAHLLRPGGMVVVTARPWRRDGTLVDFPGAVLRAAEAAGLVPMQRLVALLAALHDDRIVPRASFFQLRLVREARTAGVPLR
ncbi:MAG: TRM11 family SAM-dependent methyltransferase, partial [Solirubrobacteraceae bacterium]